MSTQLVGQTTVQQAVPHILITGASQLAPLCWLVCCRPSHLHLPLHLHPDLQVCLAFLGNLMHSEFKKQAVKGGDKVGGPLTPCSTHTRHSVSAC